MKLFDIPIRTTKWWEKILLWFCPKIITCDVAKGVNTFCVMKKLFGKYYIIKIWEEKNDSRPRGIKYDFIVYDEAITSELLGDEIQH